MTTFMSPPMTTPTWAMPAASTARATWWSTLPPRARPVRHLIDLYPGIYKGPPEGQQLYGLPQLTYADDHPGNKIPALRFAFEVTE